MKIWADTESVGLIGATKLIQYAFDGGQVVMIPLYRGWQHDLATREALAKLFSALQDPANTFVAFNAAHDLLHLLRVAHELMGYPLDSAARPVPPFACRVLDLQVPAMLYSILSPFAFQKNRAKSIARVRRLPAIALDRVIPVITDKLRQAVPEGMPLTASIHKVDGHPELKSVSWTVDARVSLKGLMKAYGIPTIALEDVWPLPDKGTESPWLPYPDPIVHDPVEVKCEEVMRNPDAGFWRYAVLDVLYLRVLYEKLGRPEPDHHSDCVHAVAYTRYYGFPLDRGVLLRTKAHYQKKVKEIEDKLTGIDLDSPKQRLEALRKLDPLMGSSAKKILQLAVDSNRPCAELAATMLGHGPAIQRLRQTEKVLQCRTGRAHPSFRVMGTRTGRMAGEAGLNWQGIGQAERVDVSELDSSEWAEEEEGLDDLLEEAGLVDEEQALVAEEKIQKVGIRAAMGAVAVGDWSSFEVVLGANIYKDEAMFYDLEHGIDPHTMNASLMQPEAIRNGWTYEYMKERIAAGDYDMITLRKQTKPVSFGIQYLCTANKLVELLGMSTQEAEAAMGRYYSRYAGFAEFRRALEKETLTADTKHWARDSVSKMAREVTDETGSSMHWDFEAQVADILWQLGGRGIRTGLNGQILRQSQKGQQTIDGAVKSALLGGALSIQQAVMRQRGNARVQATGANLTKMLMAEIWNKYRTPCLNCHDELCFSAHPNFNYAGIFDAVRNFEAEWGSRLRLLNFDMKETLHWADK